MRFDYREAAGVCGGPAVPAARRGWSVFPCRPGDKRPAVNRWEQRATAHPERVGRYWPSDRHNIGVACGPSGLVVVDLDAHGELPGDWHLPGIRDGRDVLAQLCEWASQPWPVTYWVGIPSGGWHLYFTAPEAPEIRNSAGLLGPHGRRARPRWLRARRRVSRRRQALRGTG